MRRIFPPAFIVKKGGDGYMMIGLLLVVLSEISLEKMVGNYSMKLLNIDYVAVIIKQMPAIRRC